MSERKKILIIDDEEDFTFFVKMNLEQSGKFEVTTANKGSEGIRLAKTMHPDLILLDLLMPEMSGAEVSQELIETQAMKDIPIVFLTALARKEDVEQGDYKIGGRNFIAKPVTTEELIVRIEAVLKQTG